MMYLRQWLCALGFAVSFWTPRMAVGEPHLSERSEPVAERVSQAIIQIGGRFCEYHRKDVELALRRHEAVQSIEFLNNHGTVLIRFEAGGVPPDRLAVTAAQAAFGMGCRAWVDQDGGVSPRS